MVIISKDEINEIHSKVNIVDIIGNYTPLTPKGKVYICLCPFHEDLKFSMFVSPAKQIFKCFVCGAVGNAITFVQNYEKIEFLEAIKKVANMTGINII